MRRKFWTEGPGSFLVAIGLALIIRWAFLEAYVIPSASMLPSLLVHDHIFVSKISFGLRIPFSEEWLIRWSQPERGDVIVFRYPGNKELFYVKRVVGTPGDKILFENGNLYVNGNLIEKTIPAALKKDWDWVRDADFPGDVELGGKDLYVHWQESIDQKTYSIALKKESPQRINFGPTVVPEGHFFVLGDNRDNSEDSRAWRADTQLAMGSVTFWREKTGPNITIPEGTPLSTLNGQAHFTTTKGVELVGLSIEVPVKAVEEGAIGNQPPGQVAKIEDPELARKLNVNNAQATAGGVDKRFVPLESIMGRASFVLLSCEETLPVVSFLCNPLTIRWSRFFHSVQ